MSNLILEINSFRYPVVFFANGIGDHLIVLPTLRALSRIFCGKLSLICTYNAYTEFFSDINFKKVWSIPFPGYDNQNWQYPIQKIDQKQFEYITLSKQIINCDLFISLAAWESLSLLKLIENLSPVISLGYFPSYTHEIPDNRQHVFDRDFAIAKLFKSNLMIENFSDGPALTKKNKMLVSSLKQQISEKNKLLVIHTDTKRRKMLSGGKFLKIIDEFLSRKSNYLAAIVGSYHEIPIDQAINKNRIFSLCNIPIGLSFAVVSVANLFLGIDSCMLHAADLFRIPSVAIFGATNPQRWGARFTNHFHVKSDEINLVEPEQIIEKLCLIDSNNIDT